VNSPERCPADRETSSEGAAEAVRFPECTAQRTNTSPAETGCVFTRAQHLSS